MADFLFWVIGSCFLIAGLLCFYFAFAFFLGWRQRLTGYSFMRFFLCASAGVAAEALMVFFFRFTP